MSLNKFDEKEQDFASMLEESFTDIKTFTPGEVIEAEIIAISGGCIFIPLDGKSEGQIDSEEFLDKNGNLTVKVGETIRAYFAEARHGDKIFTTKLNGNKAGKEALKSAYESSIPVEGSISAAIKGGFDIKIGDNRAFCPISQIGLKRVDNPEELVGTTHTFKITEYSEGGKNIVVSSRVLLEEEKEAQIVSLKETIKLGDIVKCRVISLEKFGAFVDLKGIQALLPISEISRTRVDKISDYLKVGDEIEAKIINLEWDRERISVSLKQLIKDPWDEAVTKYREDSKHSGIVSRIANFGVFVELEPGIEGLIHESDFKSQVRDHGAGDNLKKGQKITVLIKNVDADQKRMSLKEVTSDKEFEENKKYFDSDDSETYNPFSAFFKK